MNSIRFADLILDARLWWMTSWSCVHAQFFSSVPLKNILWISLFNFPYWIDVMRNINNNKKLIVNEERNAMQLFPMSFLMRTWPEWIFFFVCLEFLWNVSIIRVCRCRGLFILECSNSRWPPAYRKSPLWRIGENRDGCGMIKLCRSAGIRPNSAKPMPIRFGNQHFFFHVGSCIFGRTRRRKKEKRFDVISQKRVLPNVDIDNSQLVAGCWKCVMCAESRHHADGPPVCVIHGISDGIRMGSRLCP